MLRRLGLGCLDGLSLLRCRPSIGLSRSTHDLVPSCDHHQKLTDSPEVAAAAAKNSWVLLNGHVLPRDGSSVADAEAVARCSTSTGQHLRISFQRVPPPASSFLYYDLTGMAHAGERLHISVVAAHGDSVLLELGGMKLYLCSDFYTYDYFEFRAGANRPPSLCRLPARDFKTANERRMVKYRLDRPLCRLLFRREICLLRRGPDEPLMLVELEIEYDPIVQRYIAELCILRVGSRRWEIKPSVPLIIHDEDGNKVDVLPHRRGRIDMAITVGNRFLCWVHYRVGFFMWDTAAEGPNKIRFVPLPREVICRYSDNDELPPMKHSRDMGAAGDGALKFVSIDTHCCCGGPGTSTCAHSHFSFTVTTWTMNLNTDDKPMTWIKDAVLRCDELWALPGYEGLPRVHLECPVLCLDNPDLICFLVSNSEIVDSYEDRKEWMIQVDMRSKALVSVEEFTADPRTAYFHLLAKLQ